MNYFNYISYIKIIFILIIFTKASYIFAQEIYGDFLFLDIVLENNKVFLNPQNDTNLDIIDRMPKDYRFVGDYFVEFYNTLDEKVTQINVSLHPGSNLLYLPYILNSKYLLFKNKYGVILGKIDISIVMICNENNICEPGEENLCPLDCKTAKNPNYPFSQPTNELTYLITQPEVSTKSFEKEIPLPSKIFSNIFLITLATIGAILVFVLIIYFIKRKK